MRDLLQPASVESNVTASICTLVFACYAILDNDADSAVSVHRDQ
jgi:hypothetical protein